MPFLRRWKTSPTHSCTFKEIAWGRGIGTVRCIGCGRVALVEARRRKDWDRTIDALRQNRKSR